MNASEKKFNKAQKKCKGKNSAALSQIAGRNKMVKSFLAVDFEIQQVYTLLLEQAVSIDKVADLKSKKEQAKKYALLYKDVTQNWCFIRSLLLKQIQVADVQPLFAFTATTYQIVIDAFEFIGQLMEQKQLIKNINLVFRFGGEENEFQNCNQIVKWLKRIQSKQSEAEINGKQKETILEFQNVSFGYKTDQIICDNFSHQFQSGKSYAIVGPSGSGKSTVAALAIRLYQIQAGNISLDGQNINQIKLQELRTKITVCNQFDPVIANMSLKDNICYGQMLKDDTVNEIMEITQIDFIKINETVKELSGGQKQRIALARAIARKQTQVLILDESTSALDAETENIVVQNLILYCKQKFIMLIIITHRETVMKQADIVIEMKKQDM
ncbi:ABC_transporter family protein [Hexamita inflata]|uniref:ABC_transporter family protein n=1 Tax=Hexamita inflata TaxID=28002 RepID=A0ABP1GJB9_9EUKA